MKKCRVFTTFLGWSEIMFIFDESITFLEIKNNPRTNMLSQQNFIGTYEFDKNFIKCFDKAKIGDKYYFYKFSYQKDDASQEEKQWRMIPEYKPKNIIKDDIDSLF